MERALAEDRAIPSCRAVLLAYLSSIIEITPADTTLVSTLVPPEDMAGRALTPEEVARLIRQERMHYSQRIAAPLVEFADLDLPSKGAVIRDCHALSGPDESLDTYLRRALLMVIISRPLRVPRNFEKGSKPLPKLETLNRYHNLKEHL
jgi:hypothetical protein